MTHTPKGITPDYALKGIKPVYAEKRMTAADALRAAADTADTVAMGDRLDAAIVLAAGYIEDVILGRATAAKADAVVRVLGG